MPVQRILRDLERALAARQARRAARHRGLPEPAAGPEGEPVADLVRRETVARVRAAVDDGKVDPWVCDALVDLAVRVRTRAAAAELCTRRGRWRGPAGATLANLEAWLAAARRPDALRQVRREVERQLAGDREAAATLAAARAGILQRWGIVQPEWWEGLRGRRRQWIARLAERLLQCEEEATRRWLRGVAGQQLPEDLAASWVALPRSLAGWEAGAGLPCVDYELLEHVLASLGLEAAVERLQVDLDARPGKIAGGACFPLVPGARGLIVWTPSGPLRDTAALLALLGRVLPAVMAEDLRAGPESRCGDPAVNASFAALFESLCCDEGWLEYTFRRPPAPAVRCCLRGIVRVRVRWFAALAGADASLWGDPEWAPRAPAERLRRATGLEHPGGVLPWVVPPGPAADELVGMTVGAALRDRLATRWGRDWYRRSRAGRWLRDLWASGCHRRLSALCTDLDLQTAPEGDALIEFLRGHPLSR